MLSRLWLYVMNNNIEHFLELKISQNQKVNSLRIFFENSQREKNERILESLLPSPPLLLSSSLDFLKKRKMGENKESEKKRKFKKRSWRKTRCVRSSGSGEHSASRLPTPPAGRVSVDGGSNR